MKLLYPLFKSLAFQCDPERVHNIAISSFSKFPFLSNLLNDEITDERYAVTFGSLKAKFPIGLAAGFDKNGEAIDFFSRLNFGAVEIGTVTPKPQEGNSKPRIFRLVNERSLFNRMGFNNGGGDEILSNLRKANRNDKLVGVNIGKNKLTLQSEAHSDYRTLYSQFAPYADYIVINISSPNTPGLRDLQSRDAFCKIIESLSDDRKKKSVPLFVKISPDQSFDDIKDLIAISKEHNLTGIVATNTTIDPSRGPGGLSGALVKEKSKAMRNFVLKNIENSKLEVIGVGGVDSFSDLKDFWQHGGKFMQIYSSFIFEGPTILTQIREDIDCELEATGCRSVEELLQKYRR